KAYVQQVVANITNYYSSNPGKVVLKQDDYYYKDLSFTQRGEVVAQGTVVDVMGIEFTNEGIPRLKTAKGYLTANKVYVQQVA
ncbi:DUF5776 domain-containing protein, partial [Enterococcus mundtii]|uniref:DUF5776 domain-containing protein n=1 Tax=Enterococcus mundtii TaxID=53346 RepID=UPI00035EB174